MDIYCGYIDLLKAPPKKPVPSFEDIWDQFMLYLGRQSTNCSNGGTSAVFDSSTSISLGEYVNILVYE
jgi:hypothetical protein